MTHQSTFRYLTKRNGNVYKNLHMKPAHETALFIIAPNWKQPRCHLVKSEIVGDCSAIKRNEQHGFISDP